MRSASNGGILKDGLQVLHVHVLLVAPLGTGHMAQPGTDQHESRVAVRETAHHTGAAADLPVQPLNDIVGALFAVSKHFSTFFKKVLARIYFYGKLFVKVHRQTRRKSATQSYRDPPGQPVASKKLLFSAVRKYRFMKSDDAFSHGFTMP